MNITIITVKKSLRPIMRTITRLGFLFLPAND